MAATFQALNFRGTLKGHNGWVTSISVPRGSDANIAISSSRDKKLILWDLTPEDTENPGIARKSYTGHSHFVQDVVISNDGHYAISGSWDNTLRLWDLGTGSTIRTFKGHTSDVFGVAFSADNRQIVSCSRDKTIKLWNTLSECKYTITDNRCDWISSVTISPNGGQLISGGWDGLIKIYDMDTIKQTSALVGHTGPVFTVTISPDGSLCASGGKDGLAMLWDVGEGKHLYSMETSSPINALCFSPRNYWLCAATNKSIVIWDLENKTLLNEIPNDLYGKKESCSISLTWTLDGKILLVGSSDGSIYVYDIGRN